MLRSVLTKLHKRGQIIAVKSVVDPHLDLAELSRRMYAAGGPGLWFWQVKGSPFTVVSNLFGTHERTTTIFGSALRRVETAISLKAHGLAPTLAKHGWGQLPGLARAGLTSLPRYDRRAQYLHNQMWTASSLEALPQQVSWPGDGGAFITLPQVFTMDPIQPRIMSSNLGMYRIQISGGEYLPGAEAGLHYQLHRGIGIHHTRAKKRYQTTGEPWKIGIFMGGHPAYSLAAVMPLPEGMSELMIAGMLAGRRARWYRWQGYHILADADFCILGEVDFERLKPEGPFGDHLGYYSLTHDFPLLRVKHVLHKRHAVMPITVVGRPPQEDTSFGHLIHRLTAPMLPVSLPGLKEVHAVDEAGVHPLLLAVGSERYVPYRPREPMEIITQGFALLGFNQCSLAKYLIMAADEDAPGLSAQNIPEFLQHVLCRMDLQRDIHLLTHTPLDTLDYTSKQLNHGSKALLVGVGAPCRQLHHTIPQQLHTMTQAHIVMPGIAAITLRHGTASIEAALASLDPSKWTGLPLLVVCDDAAVLARSMRDFLWHTFTKSHPVDDLYGKNARFERKHWLFDGPLLIDATTKPHHPPVLTPCPDSVARVDQIIAQEPELKQILTPGASP